MNKLRSKLGDRLFKLARDVYVPGDKLRMKLGNRLFKLAAQVSPDKK